LCRVSYGVMNTTSYSSSSYFLPASGEINEWFQVQRPIGNIAITSVSFDVTDASTGNSIYGQIYLHHIVIESAPQHMFFCPDWTPRWIFATGNASTPLNYPGNYALIEGSQSTWFIGFDVLNMKSQGRWIVVEYTVTYDTNTNAYKNVVPVVFNVPGCANTQYNIPGNGGRGSIIKNSMIVSAPFTGTFIFSLGHLHNGGFAVSASDITTGTTICKSMPVYDNNDYTTGHILVQGECTNPVQVFQGDQLEIDAYYDNSKPRYGVMGIILAYMAV